jgi:ribosomal protein L35
MLGSIRSGAHEMSKQKTHKATMKRVKITGRKKVVFQRPGGRHLRSAKTPKTLRGFRGKGVAKRGEMRRLQKILFLRPTPEDEPKKVAKDPAALEAAAKVRGAAKAANKEAIKAAPKKEAKGKSPATEKSKARAAFKAKAIARAAKAKA